MAELQPASQEAERVGSGITLGITGWVILFGVLLCVAASLILTARTRTLSRAESVPAAPRPEAEVSNIRTELFRSPLAGERLKAEQRRKLGAFGWVDRERRVVRIPIEDAMDLEAQGAQP